MPAAISLLVAAAAAAAQSPAGIYEIRQMEVGGGLELKADGHFRYALDYGAVSEQGEGEAPGESRRDAVGGAERRDGEGGGGVHDGLLRSWLAASAGRS